MSDGTPTPLIRDGNVEGNDPITDEPFKTTPIPLDGNPRHDGSDLQRADDAEREPPFDPKAVNEAAWDFFGETGPNR